MVSLKCSLADEVEYAGMGFGIAAPLLYQAGRARACIAVFGAIDLLLAVVFFIVWMQLASSLRPADVVRYHQR